MEVRTLHYLYRAFRVEILKLKSPLHPACHTISITILYFYRNNCGYNYWHSEGLIGDESLTLK